MQVDYFKTCGCYLLMSHPHVYTPQTKGINAKLNQGWRGKCQTEPVETLNANSAVNKNASTKVPSLLTIEEHTAALFQRWHGGSINPVCPMGCELSHQLHWSSQARCKNVKLTKTVPQMTRCSFAACKAKKSLFNISQEHKVKNLRQNQRDHCTTQVLLSRSWQQRTYSSIMSSTLIEALCKGCLKSCSCTKLLFCQGWGGWGQNNLNLRGVPPPTLSQIPRGYHSLNVHVCSM